MDLTDEEKLILQKQIEELASLSKEDIDKIWESKKALDNSPEEKIKKLMDCPHEIVFTIDAHVLMQNEKGETTGTREISTRNYHIPVPIDKDYNSYMKIFFEYLEKKIIDTIHDTNKDAKDKEEIK
jgi:hypothetical protein